ncbi:MAG: MerR family transcriptional regulator [Chloroflexi bacterium]|nr:MerR family transcriptional regulator [Chloroflexota bacterium]
MAQEFDGASRGPGESQRQDLGWTRSDALNRMLAELFDIASAGDENRRVPATNPQRQSAQADFDRIYTRSSRSARITGVYVISVAARLAEMHPQTLRKYDKEGLVSPERSEGSRRLYSDSDVERLRVIRRLADELGLNLNGVSLVLDLMRSLTDIVSLLESSPEVSDARAARVAVDELRQILSYVGAV